MGEGAIGPPFPNTHLSLLFPDTTFNRTALRISDGKFLRGLCRPFNKVRLKGVDY